MEQIIRSEIARLERLRIPHSISNKTVFIKSVILFPGSWENVKHIYYEDGLDFMVLSDISILGRSILNDYSTYRMTLLSRTESRTIELSNLDLAKGFVVRGVLGIQVERIEFDGDNFQRSNDTNLIIKLIFTQIIFHSPQVTTISNTLKPIVAPTPPITKPIVAPPNPPSQQVTKPTR